MTRFTLALLAGLALSGPALASPPPYVLDNTEVRDVSAPELHRDYQIFVSLPPSYASSKRSYPVVFVTDANYAFPLIRSIARRVGDKPPGLEEFVLIGLSYAKGDTPTFSRNRDYTPTARAAKALKSDMPGRAPVYGEGDGYRRFLANEVLPLVAKNYRVDMGRKIFIGHSYGSLLGLDILFKDPGMFEYYVLGSPSLWYENGVMLGREKAYAASHRDLKAHVFFAVGGLERPSRAAPDDDDMVGDLQHFEALLKSRRFPGLSVDGRVFEDEDHLTVAPRIITAGLKWALPKK
ncbi:alpha/beta hydrolase-fold protein [Massilia terrae]|uniref:Alpha/beta hydrolase-fold protein n=1 Tax=Massilia terrae TaxID=1811224 RepID=A0ABT2D141_9BURK|nr:alpha/beta hydrolase-fold protein [Massilia terrae]MCS0659937.1 alpha/beta hydrolase-fold protein [Massilia terrae]